ncbi:MAG: metallophosphoesterase [Candidatus Obscuribacterales bacterium]|nr:metallophosphoesterase [Candidatus Obscuribacterales bacterium]
MRKPTLAANREDAAVKIAELTGVDVDLIRRRIANDIKARNANKGLGFLSYAGILPIDLPDGTRIVVIPDVHVPAHDKLTIWAIKAFLKDYQPHILIFIGDVADVFGLSRWAKPPRVAVNQQGEIDETRRLMDALIEISGCIHVFYIMGNHEDRMMRYQSDPAPHVGGVLDFETREPILAFHGLLGYGPNDPITFIYDQAERGGFGGALLLNGDMNLHHGRIVRPKPAASPRADADETGRSTTTGHTHRVGMTVRQTTKGEIRAIELGHLVDVTHPYMSYANLTNNWHEALGIGRVVGGRIHLQPVPIKQVLVDGRPKMAFTYGGKVYRSPNR